MNYILTFINNLKRGKERGSNIHPDIENRKLTEFNCKNQKVKSQDQNQILHMESESNSQNLGMCPYAIPHSLNFGRGDGERLQLSVPMSPLEGPWLLWCPEVWSLHVQHVSNIIPQNCFHQETDPTLDLAGPGQKAVHILFQQFLNSYGLKFYLQVSLH